MNKEQEIKDLKRTVIMLCGAIVLIVFIGVGTMVVGSTTDNNTKQDVQRLESRLTYIEGRLLDLSDRVENVAHLANLTADMYKDLADFTLEMFEITDQRLRARR